MNEIRELVKISNEIVLALERNKQQMLNDKYRQLETTVSNITNLVRTSRKLGKANSCNYINAGKRLCGSISKQLKDINYSIQNASHGFEKDIPEVPSVKTLYEELKNLWNEFVSVEINLEKYVIAVETDPIVLEELYLGTFRIELNVRKLQDLHRDSPYYCIAQEPNPAATNNAVTHPHVSDEKL